MKITVNQNNEIQLEEVYNSIVLKTKNGEEIAICMRILDSNSDIRIIGTLQKKELLNLLKNNK